MKNVVARLKQIKKEGLSEREFYSQVIAELDGLGDVRLTQENFETLKSTLLEIGCKPSNEWREEQIAKGAPDVDVMQYDRSVKGIKNASLFEGVNMVAQFLDTKFSAEMAQGVIMPGTIHSLATEWCDRNRMLYGPAPKIDEVLKQIKAIEKDRLDERGFYEEVLKVLISTRNMDEMTPDMHRQISEALREIGCPTVEEWQEGRRKEGKAVEVYKNIGLGVDSGDIGTAVTMVEKFFKSYDDAVEMSNTTLSGEVPDALKWINNSEQMRDAEMANIWTLQDLHRIDKSKMTERKFYESVLDVLSRGLNQNLSRDMHKNIKEALLEIGVQSLEDWEKDVGTHPEKIVDSVYTSSVRGYNAKLSKGVAYVSTMLGDYDTAKFNYELFRSEEGRKQIREWIDDSRRVERLQEAQARVISKGQTYRVKKEELARLQAEEKEAKKTEEEVK